MGKKSAATASAPKSSSAPTNTNFKTVGSSSTSSILSSAFAPSNFQLHLFASVIQSFESQQLRIHDTSNGRLRQQHAVSSGVEVTCLEWGRYGAGYRQSLKGSNKKRKRADGLQDVVVAYGTKTSEICLYSPSKGEVVSTLRNGHDTEVRDFKFNPTNNLEAWSVGGDGVLIQWDMTTEQILRKVSTADNSVRILSSPSTSSPQLFCASVTPYAIYAESKDDVKVEPFDAFSYPVTTLFRSSKKSTDNHELLLAADSGRFVNLFNVSQNKIARTLVVGAEILQATLSQPTGDEDQILAVTTRDGLIELFSDPFSLPNTINGDLKAQRKQMTRKANATVKLVTSTDTKGAVNASGAHVEGPNIIILSTEGGVEPIFQKLRWQDEGNGQLLFSGIKEVPRAKIQSTTNTVTMNGSKDMGHTTVNDSRTVVTNGLTESGSQQAPLEIDSSGDEGTDDDAALDVANEDADSASEAADESDEEMEDAEETGGVDATEDDGEPSFGDLLAARHPETISIANAIPSDGKSLARIPESTQMMLPSGMSLGTVLTQSLRTNDQSLLETCLHVTDEQVIRNTILRLDSSLAANLLTKLAERLADRPGRYGHLLTWVQSTMIAHGGAIASQAGVASKLRTLYSVLNERSQVLPSILLLKGKLDMMNAQQSFRQEHAQHGNKGVEGPKMIMIQGQEDNWSSDEEVDEAPVSKKAKKTKGPRKDLNALIARSESSDDEDEDVPMLNGEYHTDEEDEGSDLGDEQQNGIIDEEAEVSEDEEGSDVSSDSGEEEDDDDEADSSMEDFINDGEISMEEDDEILDDKPAKASKKKSKHRS